jgi:Protein of unknown function (DUF3313)
MKLISTSRQSTASNTILFTLALAAALSVSGCASVSAPEKSSTMTAFEQLSLQPDGTRSWRNPAAAKASAVHIDPQAIVFASDIRINDEQRQALRQTLSEALARQFSEAGIRVVATPNASPDAAAITVRANITAVELSDPALNVVTTLLLFMPVSRGSMAVEIEALAIKDSQRDGQQNGQRIAAMAFSGTAGVNNIGSAFNGVGHAKLQADIAATKFVALVTGMPQK